MNEARIGVYICDCGLNIAATVDTQEVTEHASTLPNVVVARNYKYMCSDPGQNLIKEDIKKYDLNRVVVASCSPRMHEPTFRAAVAEFGMNPFLFEMANIREHCSWIHKDRGRATEKAKRLVELSVARAALLEPLETRDVGVTPTVLVIGAGVAGSRAARDIADRGYDVYLVEREPFMGGKAAWFSKIFPLRECEETCVGDCPHCLLFPEFKEVLQNPRIHLFLRSEVINVDGYVGNFRVTIRMRPANVDSDKCVYCSECSKVCPVSVPDENNYGMQTRKAIYLPSTGVVPRSYILDDRNCGHFTGGECARNPLCVQACKFDAIDIDAKEKEVEVDVGAIVVATGFEHFDPSGKKELSCEHPRVITAPEFERLAAHTGPTGGEIVIDGVKPERVAFISCVGSREKDGNEYCSRVCCIFTAKQAHSVRRKLPDAEIAVYYTDVRTFGKGHEEFYTRVLDEGVEYRHRELDDPLEVVIKDDNIVVRCEGHEDFTADLVVLATGMVPRPDTADLCRLLNLSLSGDGFFMEAHPKLRPIDTFTDGIFLAGCCQAPKDIADSMAQSSGAAARACGILSKETLGLSVETAFADETCIGCGTCVEVCQFSAVALEEVDEKLRAIVNDALCKGCGTCIAACPSGAMQQRHFTDRQILAMIEALAGGS
ncbi:MAG: FAD-dependent oxidoreductase [Thermoplasmata archaeon]